MYGKAHGLAYLLDPRTLGQNLPTDQKSELEMQLFLIPAASCAAVATTGDADNRQEVLFEQYTQFTINATKERDKNSFRYRMLTKGKITILQYWLTQGKCWQELSQIAIKLFNLVTSSAASERNFSTMGFVHSKERNRLNPDTVEKLVFIKSNIHAFDHSKVGISDGTGDASDHSIQDSRCESDYTEDDQALWTTAAIKKSNTSENANLGIVHIFL